MRAVVQRVSRAQVRVDGAIVGSIDAGLLVLLGITHSDTAREAQTLARKLSGLRIFEDDDGRMNRSVGEVGGALLVISQFTLYGDLRKGRRPSFIDAARPEQAEPLYQHVCDLLAAAGLPVQQGRFGAHMAVEGVNDGPVTLILDMADLPAA